MIPLTTIHTQLWLKWCNVTVHVYKSEPRRFTLIWQCRAMTFSGLRCCLKLPVCGCGEKGDRCSEIDRREIERERRRLTNRERHPQRQRKPKGRDGMIGLSIVLSTRLIFVFHCFGATVIRVKVIGVWARERWSDRELGERWKRRRWGKG